MIIQMFQLPVNAAVMVTDSLLLVSINNVEHINNTDAIKVTAGTGAKLLEFAFTHLGPKTHLAEAENDLMMLSTILKSQHSAEFRLQLMDWVWSLQQLGKAASFLIKTTLKKQIELTCYNLLHSFFLFKYS